MATIIAFLVRSFWIVACWAMIRFDKNREEATFLLHYLEGSGEDFPIPEEWWEDILPALGESSYWASCPEGEKCLISGPSVGGSAYHPISRTLGDFWVVEHGDGSFSVEDVYDWHPAHVDIHQGPQLCGWWDTSLYWTIPVPTFVGWLHSLVGLGFHAAGYWSISEATFEICTLAGAKPFNSVGHY